MSLRRAFAANIVPAAALWSFAVLLLLLYWFNPATQTLLNELAQWKTRLGLGFSMPAEAVAAGLMPFFFQKFQKGDHRRTAAVHVPYMMACFAIMGAATDFFYIGQAQWFGNSPRVGTILCKVAVDMLIYCPVWSMPVTVLIYEFKDLGFEWAALKKSVTAQWYRERVIPVYMACLMVWAPTVAVIYALPLPMQFPVQAIVTVLWNLILVIMTASEFSPE